jgi:hypothetical protein
MDSKNVSDFMSKIQKMKKDSKVDLSSGEDLSIAIMNLVSIEEHFFFTAQKTGKGEYYDLLKKVRDMRKSLLEKIVVKPEGEVWCISKHLLAASMRVMEVGTKALNQGKQKDAEDLFNKAYELYTLFWGLNLNLIDPGKVTKIDDEKINVEDKSKTNLWGKLNGVVKKLVDCCIE